MLVVHSYPLAVGLCVVTMLCWGSWANTQKLASRKWPFQLYYWDFAIGLFIGCLAFALTAGSFGSEGRSFIPDLRQAAAASLGWAFLGGVIMNFGNVFLVGALDIAGMAVAFPLGIGLALVIGVTQNHFADPSGNAVVLFAGLGLIVIAMVFDALAFRRVPAEGGGTGHIKKGIVLSIVAGIGIGVFYRFVQAAMATDFAHPEPGKLTPYTAVAVFSLGVLVSNFLWNGIVMKKPFEGPPVPFADYFRKGTPKLHLVGALGGIIWAVGVTTNIIASGKAGPAISYGIGQGATMVSALWGVFVWKEFKKAPAGTNKLLALMFVFYIAGLVAIVAAKL